MNLTPRIESIWLFSWKDVSVVMLSPDSSRQLQCRTMIQFTTNWRQQWMNHALPYQPTTRHYHSGTPLCQCVNDCSVGGAGTGNWGTECEWSSVRAMIKHCLFIATLPTFLSSGLIWANSMAMLSVFHTQEWLVKYSSTIMALWRRVIVFIILWQTACSGGAV